MQPEIIITQKMNTLTLHFVCQSLHLPLYQSDAPIERVITDSRQAKKGDLFVALIGEKHDAHDFVPQVLSAGAYALVSRDDCAHLSGCLKVEDTLIALQTLAAAWRQESQALVFGITGSSGKTTVKEMLFTILKEAFGEKAVLATKGNFNNHIGLPLTLLNLNANHRYAVIEMGMSGFGELACLTRLAKPDIALVNNAMRAHIGCGFNGIDDIARAKSEIYQGLCAPKGIAILPQEDANKPIFQAASESFIQHSFGLHSGDVHAENIRLNELSSDFVLCFGDEKIQIHLPVAGEHNIANACAAAALALAAELTLDQIQQGLRVFSNIKGRLNHLRGQHGGLIIDDTYNANPDSMKAALNVLANLPKPQVFIMGDMGELGDAESEKMHAEIGEYARHQKIDLAIFIGKDARFAAESFAQNALCFENKEAFLTTLNHDFRLPENASVLVKGSRFMQMEKVLEQLV